MQAGVHGTLSGAVECVDIKRNTDGGGIELQPRRAGTRDDSGFAWDGERMLRLAEVLRFLLSWWGWLLIMPWAGGCGDFGGIWGHDG